MSTSKARSRQTILTVLLLVVSTVTSLGLAEAVLRLIAPRGYYVWPPSFHARFDPAPGALPGVFGPSKLETNEWGIRGRAFSDEDRFRILAIGGSTTECLYLDDGEAWPHLLEERLNGARFEPKPVWVGNVAKSGHNSAHHVRQVEKLIDQYPKIDMVLALVGTNDMMAVLQDGGYVPWTEKELREAFVLQPGLNLRDETYPFYKRTELWRRLRRVKDEWLRDDHGALIEDAAGSLFATMRMRRQHARTILEEPPDLTAGVREYRANLNAIVDSVTKRGARIVFLTQPSLWSRHGTPETERLMWMGKIGRYMNEDPTGYYSIGAIERAMNVYNEALLEVCAERHVRCLDLAAAVPKTSEVFYDDVHFTEAGARRVAELVAEFLEQP